MIPHPGISNFLWMYCSERVAELENNHLSVVGMSICLPSYQIIIFLLKELYSKMQNFSFFLIFFAVGGSFSFSVSQI